MQLILSLAPLMVISGVYCIFIKFAAHIMRNVSISWSACFLFSLIIFASYGVATQAEILSQSRFNTSIATFGLIIMHIGLAGIYFGRYARNDTGHALGWKKGYKLAAIVLALYLVTFMLLSFVLTLLF